MSQDSQLETTIKTQEEHPDLAEENIRIKNIIKYYQDLRLDTRKNIS